MAKIERHKHQPTKKKKFGMKPKFIIIFDKKRGERNEKDPFGIFLKNF